jgi:hypothetical protein
VAVASNLHAPRPNHNADAAATFFHILKFHPTPAFPAAPFPAQSAKSIKTAGIAAMTG